MNSNNRDKKIGIYKTCHGRNIEYYKHYVGKHRRKVIHRKETKLMADLREWFGCSNYELFILKVKIILMIQQPNNQQIKVKKEKRFFEINH